MELKIPVASPSGEPGVAPVTAVRELGVALASAARELSVALGELGRVAVRVNVEISVLTLVLDAQPGEAVSVPREWWPGVKPWLRVSERERE